MADPGTRLKDLPLVSGDGIYLFLGNGQRLALNIIKPINVVWDAAISAPKTWS